MSRGERGGKGRGATRGAGRGSGRGPAKGKTRGKIVVFDLGRGEGVGPYANRAPMIFNAATTYLC